MISKPITLLLVLLFLNSSFALFPSIKDMQTSFKLQNKIISKRATEAENCYQVRCVGPNSPCARDLLRIESHGFDDEDIVPEVTGIDPTGATLVSDVCFVNYNSDVANRCNQTLGTCQYTFRDDQLPVNEGDSCRDRCDGRWWSPSRVFSRGMGCRSNLCTFDGYLYPGHSCAADRECIVGRCLDGRCESVEEGGECKKEGDDHNCAWNLFCNADNVCEKMGEENDACDDSHPCQRDLACASGACRELFSVPSSGTCGDEDWVCQKGLYCHDSEGVCKTPVGALIQNECEDNQDCTNARCECNWNKGRRFCVSNAWKDVLAPECVGPILNYRDCLMDNKCQNVHPARNSPCSACVTAYECSRKCVKQAVAREMAPPSCINPCSDAAVLKVSVIGLLIAALVLLF